MSRSGYVDDYEHMSLWRGTVDRALRGKRGQKFLTELALAMDAMPVKALITSELITAEGDCCTLGVVCKARQLDVRNVDVTDPEVVGDLVGISRAMAAEIEYLNDEWGPSKETPEERWLRMRAWVKDQLEGCGQPTKQAKQTKSGKR